MSKKEKEENVEAQYSPVTYPCQWTAAVEQWSPASHQTSNLREREGGKEGGTGGGRDDGREEGREGGGQEGRSKEGRS